MRRFNLLALLLFIAALVWIFILPKEKVQQIQRTVGSWFSPFTRTGAKVQDAIVGATEEVKSPDQLRSENNDLHIEVDQLRIQQQNLENLEKENSDLRVALEFRKRYALELIPAEIINRKQSAWYREALIDKGLKHRVREQSPVLAAVQVTEGGVSRFEGALVGKIGRVEDNSATVVFLTDENCRVSATVKGMSNVRGICMGNRATVRAIPDLRLRFLKSEPELRPGLQVMSDSVGGVFPFGVLLGEVKEWIKGDGTAEALVHPAVDFDVLRHVFVLLQQDAPPVPPIQPPAKTK